MQIDDNRQNIDNNSDEGINIETMVKIRQTYIDNFFISGGVRNKTLLSEKVDTSILQFPSGSGIITRLKAKERIKQCYNVDILSKLSYAPLALSDVTYGSNRQLTSRMGVSAIRFDRYGALFAVGGSNGVLRVFDFDEWVYTSNTQPICQTKHIEAVVMFDTKKDISDFRWSLVDDDLIFICHSFHPEILILDLNDTSRQRVLEIGKEVTSGYKTMLLLPSWDGSASEKVVAGGSSNGVIRFWNNYRMKNRPSWEILSDPTSSTRGSAGVVNILPLHHHHAIEGGLLSVDAMGIITLWDCKNLTTSTFGSSGSPTCLLRLNMMDAIIQDIPPTKYDLKLIGLEYNNNNTHGSSDDDIIATFNSGYVCSFNINASFVKIDHIVALNKVKALVAADPVRYTDEFGFTIQLSSGNMICPASPFRALHHNFLLLQDCQRQQGLAIIQYEKHHQLLDPIDNKMSTQRCLDHHFTLQGHIIACEHGSHNLVTSHDLSCYLIAANIASSYPSKSPDILFDWRLSSSSSSSSLLLSIASISGHMITLSQPYTGPTVTQGHPRIMLRTNLKVEFYRKSSSISSTWDAMKYKLLSYESPVSKICAHPSSPYAIIGFINDTVKVLHLQTNEAEVER